MVCVAIKTCMMNSQIVLVQLFVVETYPPVQLIHLAMQQVELQPAKQDVNIKTKATQLLNLPNINNIDVGVANHFCTHKYFVET